MLEYSLSHNRTSPLQPAARDVVAKRGARSAAAERMLKRIASGGESTSKERKDFNWERGKEEEREDAKGNGSIIVFKHATRSHRGVAS